MRYRHNLPCYTAKRLISARSPSKRRNAGDGMQKTNQAEISRRTDHKTDQNRGRPNDREIKNFSNFTTHPLSAASRIFSDHRQRFALLSRADLREKSHTHQMPARIGYDPHGSPITHPREQIQNTRRVPRCLFGHMPYQNVRPNTIYSILRATQIQPIVFTDRCCRITPTHDGKPTGRGPATEKQQRPATDTKPAEENHDLPDAHRAGKAAAVLPVPANRINATDHSSDLSCRY